MLGISAKRLASSIHPGLNKAAASIKSSAATRLGLQSPLFRDNSQELLQGNRSEGYRWGLWHGLASQAEDFDLIAGDDEMARINGHDEQGFLVNKKYLPGSVLCSGRLVTLWAADKYESITPESLSILLLMRPPPDLLLLGCGPRMLPPPADLQKWLASQGVALECLSTVNASSTFNILNQEGRAVVGAFLPSS